MGRKKKEMEIKEEISGVQIKDKTGYEGSVVLKLQKKGKILKTITTKNMGTLRLFQGMALALQNTSSSVLVGSYLPQYLDAGSDNISGSVRDTKLKSSILKTNRVPLNPLYPVLNNIDNPVLEEPTGYISKFVGVIPYDLIGGANIRELGLFADKTGDTLLARITIPDAQAFTISQGMNLIVEWRLDIENKGE